jgi:uncharacterized protein YggU (UPF0235/DUF167 family)
MTWLRGLSDGIELLVWVVPRAAKPGLGPLHGDRLRAAVSAPPVEGAANDALRRLVAAAVGVARSAVSVERGETGRNKTLRVSGDPAMLLARARTLAGEIDAVPTAAATTPASANQPRSRKR